MRPIRTTALLCAAFLVGLTGLSPALAATMAGTVVGVSDGDTVTVLDDARREERVRLKGIDAPEKRQPFGERSKQSLSALLYRQPVTVQWEKRDRYGRIIGQVFVVGSDASLVQLRSGMAWVYTTYITESTPMDCARYREAEQAAQIERRGLWNDPAPVPPWQWRKKR